MKKINIKLLIIFFVFNINSQISIINHNSQFAKIVLTSLNELNIDYSFSDNQKKYGEDLYIIFDAYKIEDFPKNYIVYQTVDLAKFELSDKYSNTLKNAISVWDYKQSNINKYKKNILNYYYFPENYIYSKAIVLACSLPNNLFQLFKELLVYSNKKNTDISSLIPIMFVQSVLQNPKNILEIGVRSGESTKVFLKVAEIFNSSLVGLDIDCTCAKIYNTIKNTEFYCMDDTKFPDFYLSKITNLEQNKFDIIFIDTSHLYDHTYQEIKKFIPLLSDKGLLMFHDSHMSPLKGNLYQRLNNTMGKGWDNKKGVIRAIKDFFNITLDETKINDFDFNSLGFSWNLKHYPFCNGLTIIKKNF